MVYLTSDIHGAFDIHKINPDEFKAASQLGPDDYLVICGDFGCIWDGGSSDNFWLNWLESLPWTTVFIDGNHENFDVLNEYPVVDWKGGKAGKIRSNIYHLRRGERYEFGDKSWLCLGGGFSHDVAYRSAGINWWEEEIFSKEEVEHTLDTLEKCNWRVDCILSHDIFSSHPITKRYTPSMNLYSSDRVNQQDFLEMIRQKTDYSIWFFGHYHQDNLDFFDGKPVYMLFDTVEEVDTLKQKAEEMRLKISSSLKTLDSQESCVL